MTRRATWKVAPTTDITRIVAREVVRSTLAWVIAGAAWAGPLTLEGALGEAREKNPAIRAMREEARAAGARVPQARAWARPELEAKWEDIPEGGFKPGEAGKKLLGVRQAVPFPGKPTLSARAASAGAEAAEARASEAERVVLAAVGAAYFELYRAHYAASLAQERLDVLEGIARAVEARYQVGKATHHEVLRAHVARFQADVDAVTREREREVARAKLAALLGWSGVDALREIARPPLPAEPPSGDALLAQAAAKRPALVAARREAVGAARGATRALVDWLPDFTLGYWRVTDRAGAPAGHEAMLSAQVPLWFWGQAGAVKAARAGERAAEARAMDVENETRWMVREASVSLDAARRTLGLYERSLIPHAEQALKSARAEYEGGKVDLDMVLESEKEFIEARLAGFRALADVGKWTGTLGVLTGLDLFAPAPVPGGGQP